MSARRVRIDAADVEHKILEMAGFGAHGETGVWRTVYSPEWVAATTRYREWCQQAGLETHVDAVGNVWGTLRGSDSAGKSIVSGSHIDSQTPGGRYDGSLGAIAALIALRALKEQFGQPKITLEAIAFCEEESSRFPSANFWGSRAITGRIAPGDADTVIGFNGETIAAAMHEVGLDPERSPEAKREDIGAFIELHVEQGPILEQLGLPVGIVSGITGIRHYRIELTGVENHAGAFPMDLRRDAVQGFCEIARTVVDTAHRWGRPAVTTVGRVEVEPNLTAAVAKMALFTVDARHPNPDQYRRLLASHEAVIREVASRRDLGLKVEVLADHDTCLSDPAILASLEVAARNHKVATHTMASGAGHDAQQMASIAPVAMVFVRSKDGRSHTPEEFSSIEDIVKGVEVLAGGLLEMAY